MKSKALLFIVSLILVSCGTDRRDRAWSGAGIGAGVGAVGSAVSGGSPVTGALIGAGVGAAAGGLTDEEDVNLGDPVWHKKK